MTNAAKDFIEQILKPWLESRIVSCQASGSINCQTTYETVAEFLDENSDKWDKPSEQGVVDEEAKRIAMNIYYGIPVEKEEMRKINFILREYESAKATIRESRKVEELPQVNTISGVWEESKKFNDARLREIEKVSQKLDKATVAKNETVEARPATAKGWEVEQISVEELLKQYTSDPVVKKPFTTGELPPLPEKIAVGASFQPAEYINALIDCVAALYKRGG